MLKVYSSKNNIEWDAEVKTYQNWDVYYLYEYAHSFMLHGDGEPLLICYKDNQVKFCYVVMKQDIGDSSLFTGALAKVRE